MKQDDAKVIKLQEKENYNSYQEKLGFAKELLILRNDFYYQMTNITKDSVTLVDFLYQPLDIMSGDAYSARRIDEFNTFYLIIDGMGKGMSASLTAMIMTSFVNHMIDKMIQLDHFNLNLLVHETLNYIKNTLLDEEALAIDYTVIDDENDIIHYAKFAMPVSLMQNSQDEVIRLQSNNPPMSKYLTDFKVSTYDISDIDKFLFYSDGIVENSTIHEGKTYADFIENDFKNSFTRKELSENIFAKISAPEDDFTLAFVNKLSFNKDIEVTHRVFGTSLEELDKASEWYEKALSSICQEENVCYRASLIFGELFMNAYEHGSLGLDSVTKHKLLADDIYFERLQEDEKSCDKSITVRIDKIKKLSSEYIVTQISDEGLGFDTQTLSKIFRNSKNFNGRGVIISRKNSMGIYYNAKGNTVLYLNKV